jgi:hypothetical protein
MARIIQFILRMSHFVVPTQQPRIGQNASSSTTPLPQRLGICVSSSRLVEFTAWVSQFCFSRPMMHTGCCRQLAPAPAHSCLANLQCDTEHGSAEWQALVAHSSALLLIAADSPSVKTIFVHTVLAMESSWRRKKACYSSALSVNFLPVARKDMGEDILFRRRLMREPHLDHSILCAIFHGGCSRIP